MGNVDATQRAGVLFIDFATQRRIRVDVKAELRHDDLLLARNPGAQFMLYLHVDRAFPNCGRYIHHVERQRSRNHDITAWTNGHREIRDGVSRSSRCRLRT